MHDLEAAKTTLPISIWGVPVQKWAGRLGYSHTGNSLFQIEFVSIWGLTYICWSPNWNEPQTKMGIPDLE